MKKIIVFGGGQVGSSVAKILSDDGNDITLVDVDKSVLENLKEQIDIKTIHGLASHPSIQRLADADNSDMVIAVTGNDEVNMVICQIAFSIFKIPKKIARIRSQDYLNPKFTRVYNKENIRKIKYFSLNFYLDWCRIKSNVLEQNIT